MNCRFCNEELPERGDFCPYCGRNQRVHLDDSAPSQLAELGIDEEELAAQAMEFTYEEPEVEKPVEEMPAELKKAKRLALFSGCIAALAVLAMVLFMGIRGGWEVKDLFNWKIFKENNLYCQDSYTVKDKKAYNQRNKVVATMGDKELTNGQLQIYYWNEVYEFVNNNYYYLSYLGLDYTKPLDEQTYTKDKTWQQYFLELALQSWQANQALALEAEAHNYVMPAEKQKELDNMAADLETKALSNGYKSANEMVQDSFGPGCTLDDYISYMKVYYYGYMYFAEEYEKLDPSMAQIEEYFTLHEQELKESGITKEEGNVVAVRHILMNIANYKITEEQQTRAPIQNEDTEDKTESTDKEETKDQYSEAEWAACLAEAERILQLWLEDPTEENFGKLANEHSDDKDGKVTDGGIYTGITSSTSFVKPFLDWCMDKERQVGDYGIVKTDYGYHIMYFSETEPIWVAECRDAWIGEQAQALVNRACETHVADINYKQIVLAQVSF